METCPRCAAVIDYPALSCECGGSELGPAAGVDLSSAFLAAAVPVPARAAAHGVRKSADHHAWGLLAIGLGLFLMVASTAAAGSGPWAATWFGVELSQVAAQEPVDPVPPAPPTEAPGSTPAATALALVDARAYQSPSGGYWFVAGQVRNLSPERIKYAEVVARWYDDAGRPIATDSASLDVDPLMPGQASMFETVTRRTRAMTKFEIEFRDRLGDPIPARDDRKK
jgi:hypothetical protein